MMGCFAEDDRTGRLIVREFAETPCCTLTTADWYTAVPSDYLCNYIGLSVTGLQGTFFSGTDNAMEIGNTMIIADSPAWDYGDAPYLQHLTDDLYNYLHGIAYTPCEIDMPSDASFDCGDRITLIVPKVDGTSGTETISTLITQLEWRWYSGMSITSGGINPIKGSGSSGSSGSTNRVLTQQTSENKIYFYHFTNSDNVVVGENQTKELATVRINVDTDSQSMFIATILVHVEVDDISYDIGEYTGYRDGHSNVSIRYSMDNTMYDYIATDCLANGNHIITVQYPLTGLEAKTSHRFTIYITCDNGTVTVAQNTTRATIFGQGLAVDGSFMGYFEVEDSVTILPITPLVLWGVLTDNASCVAETTPELNVIADDGNNLIADDGNNIITD